MLSTLALGIIKVRHNEIEELFSVTGGIIEMQPGIVIILADAAEHVDDINVERTQKACQRASLP